MASHPFESASTQQSSVNPWKTKIQRPVCVSNIQREEEEDPTALVTIYLHGVAKKSAKIEVASKSSIQDIKKIIESKLDIKKDRQLLYLNGKNVTQYGYVRLQSNNIIHIASSDQLCSRGDSLNIKLIIMSDLGKTPQKTQKMYEILSDQEICAFLKTVQNDFKTDFPQIDSKTKFYLIQSSRILEKDKSFAQQDITKNSEIICVITNNEMQTRFSNDTKQEIFNDISQLLGFEAQEQQKTEPPKIEKRTIRPRYLQPIRSKKPLVTLQSSQDDQDPYGLRDGRPSSFNTSATLPNFKKKPQPLIKSHSFDESPRQPVKKIKSSKSKKDLEELFQAQHKQKYIFESPEVIKEVAKEEKSESEDEEGRQEVIEPEKKKSSPQIPKSMPVKERRQIRLEIQKLFAFHDESLSSKEQNSQSNTDNKEEKKPISPATQTIKPTREKDPMRLSLGSRPHFLDQLRNNLGSNKPQED